MLLLVVGASQNPLEVGIPDPQSRKDNEEKLPEETGQGNSLFPLQVAQTIDTVAREEQLTLLPLHEARMEISERESTRKTLCMTLLLLCLPHTCSLCSALLPARPSGGCSRCWL